MCTPVEFGALHIGRTHTSFCPKYLESCWHGINLSNKASFPWLCICYLRDTALDLAIPNLGVVYLTNVLPEAIEGSRLTFLVCHGSHSHVCIKKRKKKKSPVSLLPRSCFLPFCFVQCKSGWSCGSDNHQSPATKLALPPSWFPQGQKDVRDVRLGSSAVLWCAAQSLRQNLAFLKVGVCSQQSQKPAWTFGCSAFGRAPQTQSLAPPRPRDRTSVG